MFTSLTQWLNYIEALPTQQYTPTQQEQRLIEARQWIVAHNLTPKAPVITVTGTNGKGSTIQALKEMLVQHRHNVCTFTSPHLIHYHERFTHNLNFIEDTHLLSLANQLADLIDYTHWNLFFILFFIFLLWCKELSVACVILEVGVGGRLDPTNALDANLVILTQIALDHTELLGNTREAIGLEKLGLLRKKTLLVCAEPDPPKAVIEKALQQDCIIYQINQQFGFRTSPQSWHVWFQGKHFAHLPRPQLALRSICTALQAAQVLFPGIYFSRSFMQYKLPLITLAGRLQRIEQDQIEWVIDVAHNPAAVAFLAKYLQTLPTKNTYAIFGSKATKDIAAMTAIMQPIVHAWYVVPISAAQQADTAYWDQTRTLFSQTPQTASNAVDAAKTIQAQHHSAIRVVAFGSFSVAGALLAYLAKQPHKISGQYDYSGSCKSTASIL
jgi:dihydrofolate synthase / folylpolyglutamate synthase